MKENSQHIKEERNKYIVSIISADNCVAVDTHDILNLILDHPKSNKENIFFSWSNIQYLIKNTELQCTYKLYYQEFPYTEKI